MIPDRAPVLALAARWGLVQDGDWIETPSSLLLPVRRDQEALILKAADPEDDEADHPALLAHWRGTGMVRLLAAEGSVSLMERAGTPTLPTMVRAGRDAEAMALLIGAAERLAGAPAWDGPARPGIESRFDSIRAHLKTNPPHPADAALFQAAINKAGRLTQERVDWRLLHGDLHHFNLLPSDRGWLAIDPKGLIGPPAYEIAPMLCNPLLDPIVHTPGRYRARAEQAAALGGMPLQPILDWSFCHLAQCAAWTNDPAERPFWLASLRIAAREAGVV